MLSQVILFLLDTVLGAFVYVVMVRFYLQLFRAPFNNPVSQFVVAITRFAVNPLRKIIPGLWGMDLATLFLAWLTEVVLIWAIIMVGGGGVILGLNVLPMLAFLAVVRLLKVSVQLLIGAVFIQAILSWVNPYSAGAPVLDCLTRPFLGPVRRFIPPIAGVDLSPLVIFVICELVLMAPIAMLETIAPRLML
ncbi:MAG: YggT family protein [Sulfuricella sp.]|nr:YggT family protein [Sulfuricella sp.]